MASQDWSIPAHLRPSTGDWSFDLGRTLGSVVGIRAEIPDGSFTAQTLGTDRAGSGVVIRESGMVLTVGYLVMEARRVWLTCQNGRVVPGDVVAVDHESGFGLVQALGRLDTPAIAIGSAVGLDTGAAAILAAGGGIASAVDCRVVARESFAGSWEYVIDDAIYTAPAHPMWGGNALIGVDGALIGIGSLIVGQTNARGQRLDMNMTIPVDIVLPILEDLLRFGMRSTPGAPWLGILATEHDGGVVVEQVFDHGPSAQADVEPGDRVLSVEGTEVSDLGEMWRAVRRCGPAGTAIRLGLSRDSRPASALILSVERNAALRRPTVH